MGNPPPTHLITPISDERRGEILDETLARRPDDGPLRIFGYGSLMWSPCFDVADRHLCTLRDYHRGFSIWSVFARGTPEHPGLGFALEEKAGTSCKGIVFTLPGATTRDDLIPLWEREMWTETYHPEWVMVETESGSLGALTFVVSTDHPQYAGDLLVVEKAAYIAKASGNYGTCYDYLAQTVEKMRDMGVHDAEMEELLTAVDAVMR
ncbi:MAG: gamma-glutamylcyclotransferase [Rhodospirillaceae bacterium]|nr:MAG: gamma-glutamylcyclotransferase [Rhodospirillaceae bacterium]